MYLGSAAVDHAVTTAAAAPAALQASASCLSVLSGVSCVLLMVAWPPGNSVLPSWNHTCDMYLWFGVPSICVVCGVSSQLTGPTQG